MIKNDNILEIYIITYIQGTYQINLKIVFFTNELIVL